MFAIPFTRGVSVGQVVKDLKPRLGAHHTMAFAGSLAYGSIFAVLPMLLLVVLLLGFFNAEGLLERFLEASASTLPADASALIRDQLQPIVTSRSSAGFGIGAIFSMLVAIWSVSGAMRSLMEAVNVMHETQETRSFVRRYVTSILLAIASVLLLVTALTALVIGPGAFEAISNVLGLGSSGGLAWQVIRLPLALVLVLSAFSLLYWIAPDVDQKFRFITIGSVVATALWLAFSLAFSLYANSFATYGATWGALAGAIVFMLYVYYSSVILLIGAQVDAIVEQRSPAGTTGGVARVMQRAGRRMGAALPK